jgi:phage-related protein
MSDLYSALASEQLSHISNYSGIFETGVSYKKFDFVYSTGDGLFYYAREDMVFGGGSNIQDSNRLSLVPDGPYTSEGRGHYIVDGFNDPYSVGSDFQVGQLISLSGSLKNNDGKYKILNIETDVVNSINNSYLLTGALITVVGIESDGINSLEISGANQLTLSEINVAPSENDNLWTADKFFFDADYGSTANFTCNNYSYDYGNGYSIKQPKTVNSLNFEVDLKFENRTNREANAIIHFLENHQGQKEKDKPSQNLLYSQGISGFRWDGSATFHPYDSLEVQTKNFYCSEFSHDLSFENSNNITVKLRSLDTSLLQKSESLLTNKADEYSSSEYYERNDVVFNSENHRYYYCKKQNNNLKPVQKNQIWTRLDGHFKDINKDYWSREFFWKPSIGLSVSQKPRVLDLSLIGGYTQVYKDGINESLLELDLKFDNRDDSEAYAILHFLEQHYGCIPFLFTPPAPYETLQNFTCQEWQHTYTYKNNHSITARFQQCAFNYSAQQYDNQSAPAPLQPGEVFLTSPFVMSEENVGSTIYADEKLKKRLYIKNVGDQVVSINSMGAVSDGGRSFNLIHGSVLSKDIDRSGYIFYLPTSGMPFGLNGKLVKISKTYSDGPDGGHSFIAMKIVNGEFTPDGSGASNFYFQNNKGQIKTANSSFVDCDYFVVTKLFENNGKTIIQPKSEVYVDVVSSPGSGHSISSLGLSPSKSGEYTGGVIIKHTGINITSSSIIKIFVV